MRYYEEKNHGNLPYKLILRDFVDEVCKMIAMRTRLNIKTVPKGSLPDAITTPFMGYNPSQEIALLSDPRQAIGCFGLDVYSKILVYSREDLPIFAKKNLQRFQTPDEERYVRKRFDDVLREFYSKGFRIHEFNPSSSVPSLYAIEEFDAAFVGKEISLEELLDKV